MREADRFHTSSLEGKRPVALEHIDYCDSVTQVNLTFTKRKYFHMKVCQLA